MLFEGARIDGRKPYEITRLGIARTFQNIRLFPDLSVLENVMTARHLRSRQTLADAILACRVITRRNEIRTRSMALLEIFDLRPGRRNGHQPPTAASAGSRSPARWPQTRGCCCSTSRRPA